MKLKALKNFAGAISMSIGEIKECNDMEVFRDLIAAGYAEEYADIQKKGVKRNEGKRDTSKAPCGVFED